MEYRTVKLSEAKGASNKRRQFTDKKGHIWMYLTRKEYLELPSQERRICADMRKKDSGSANLLLRDGNTRWGLYQYRPSKKFSEKLVGYIPVVLVDNTGNAAGKASCIRVLERSFLKAYIVPLLLLLLLLGGILSGLWYLREDEIPGLDEAAIAYHVEGLKNENPEQILMPGITGITMRAGNTHIEQVLYNPEGNPCYFKYRIIMQDTEEVLYESGLIEPGMAVMEFDLNRPLDPGVYNVTVLAETTSVEDGKSKMNQGAANTTITVE